MTLPLPTSRTGRIERPDGATIVYEITGSGPALLFAHGLGGNHFSWWQQLPVFARTHTCIAFSHRGFAPSTVPSGAPDPHDYAGDAAALLDHLEIDTVVHVGQSMGGWTGVELALHHPDRLAGLVLACTTGTLGFDEFGDPAIAAWRKRAPQMVEEMNALGVHRATGKVFAANEPVLHHLYGMIDRLNAGLDKEEVRRRLWAMRSRGPDDAARIRCPVLCITGEDDAAIAPASVRAVARHIPNAEVVAIPETGHSVYFERADLFNAILAKFLEGIGWR